MQISCSGRGEDKKEIMKSLQVVLRLMNELREWWEGDDDTSSDLTSWPSHIQINAKGQSLVIITDLLVLEKEERKRAWGLSQSNCWDRGRPRAP